MTWMAIGFWIFVGGLLATGVWMGFMAFVSKRQERHDATVRAVLDKIEKAGAKAGE